jgi:hypothetical protein
MSTNIVPSLDTLPVELLYRIFDNLDAETILLSIQYVCRWFHSVTNNYNRNKLNFQSIFKHTFHQLCRTTCPKNVISLTLSDENQTPGQTGLFLSLHYIEEYTRLRSITLISIEEPYLELILKHLSTKCALTSLVIQCELTTILNSDTLQFLSGVIAKASLRKLDLTFAYGTMRNLEWPIECSIQYLRVFTSVHFDKFCTILRSSPHLETMILRDCIVYDIDELNRTVSNNVSYRQLTSLTLQDSSLEMTTIESLLSLTPSLVHFTLIGNGDDLFDGVRWEQFIQTKLPDLNKFEFAFQSDIDISHDSTGLESLIASFQTPFWLEKKQWFVTALCVKSLSTINLYTTRDCAPKINFRPKANKISRSTAPTTIKDLITMDVVRELSLDLLEMQADMTDKVELIRFLLLHTSKVLEIPRKGFYFFFVPRKKYQHIDYLINSINSYFALMKIGRAVRLNFFHHSSICQLSLCLNSTLDKVIVSTQ